MQLIDEQTAEMYLRETGRIAPSEAVEVRELSGGVSNMVLAVDFPHAPARAFVLKQARAQLRTVQPWFSNVERIWREAEVLDICSGLLQASSPLMEAAGTLTARTPFILFEDRENYLFAMNAAPRPNRVWKQDLLNGQVDPQVAIACGRLLATLHGNSWLDGDIAKRLGDTTLFDELRVDPYYRALAAAHPDMREVLRQLIDSLADHPRSLVHADFSPKNLLVFSGGLMMVDFETGHYGDPAFDLGFFLSHLVLKACHKIPRQREYLALSTSFCDAYDAIMEAGIGRDELASLWSRGILHFAGCAWARLDGKSPIDYLSNCDHRNRMRGLCRELFRLAPTRWPEVVDLCSRAFA